MIRLVDRAIFLSLLGLVLLAPIPFGSIYPWSWTLMGVIVGVLLLAWCLRHALTGEAPPVGLRRTWPLILPFALVCLWIVVQMATWTPESWHHPMWKTAAEVLGREIDGRISLTPFDSGSMLMRLLTYGGIFWLALQYGRNSRDALRAVQALALASLAYAVYGLTVELTGSHSILWYDKERYVDDLTGTFRYKNAYATYAGLGILCAVALVFRRIDETAMSRLGPRERLYRLTQALLERDWIYVIAAAIVVCALFLSHSRAGVIATGLGLLVLLGAVGLRRGRALPFMKMLIGVFAIGFVGLATMTGGTTLDRLERTKVGTDVRALIYEGTRRAIADAPWLGTGAGSFEEAFAPYKPAAIPNRVLRAHSSYLEHAMELGIPGSALLVLPLLIAAGICVLGIRNRRRDSIFPCIGLSAAALVGFHAAFDFTMQVPAVAATFHLMMGIACGQSWSSRGHSD